MMKDHLWPLLGIITVQVLLAGYGIFAKLAFETNDVYVFTILRNVATLPVAFIFTWINDGIPHISWKAVPRIAALGLFGVCGNQVFFNLGLAYTNPTNASIIRPTVPVITSLFAVLSGLEPLSYNIPSLVKILGMLVTVTGALVMVGFSGLSSGSDNVLLGNVYLVLSCLCLAIYLTIQKPSLDIYPASRVNFWSFVFGLFFITIPCLPFATEASQWKFDKSFYIAIAYTAVFGTTIAFGLILWSGKRLSPIVTSAFFALQPVPSALLAWIVLHDAITLQDLLGGSLCIIGLFAVCWARYSEGKAALKHMEYQPIPDIHVEA